MHTDKIRKEKYTIAVAGMGYVGLSIATLLAQHHKVYAVDVIPGKSRDGEPKKVTYSR